MAVMQRTATTAKGATWSRAELEIAMTTKAIQSHLHRPSSSIGFAESSQSTHSRRSYGDYDQNSYSDGGASSYSHDRPITPTGPYHEATSSTEIIPYLAPYESSLAPQPPARRPRYSIPASSSGFMPIPTPTPAPSSFQTATSFSSLPSQYSLIGGRV